MEITRIGPYRLADRLGAGGMGVVYRAYDERLDRWVAIKLLHPGGGKIESERLRREARASARFSHPAIVQIFDLVEHKRSQGIVMELVEGMSVAERIRQGTLAPDEAFAISREVSDALAVAHAHGIVHRDLKAENVLITPDGHAKVLDFGMAKHLDRGESSLTMEGMVVGTARSMSPEQAQGGEVDFRSDLFSLGVLLYEMFTEISPFVAPTALATLGRVCNHVPRPVLALRPRLPRELSEIIDRLLEKQAERRPRDAREVAQLLSEIAPAFARPESGRAVEAAASPPPPSVTTAAARQPASLPSSGERRQLTFLSCGLVHPKGGRLDAEELLDAIAEVDATVVSVIRRFGGSLKPGGSDGWQACFGYPRAFEDDARRAVTAALELATGMDAASVRPTIGIFTGPMIVARTDSGESDPALGETPQIAMMLQRLASPGTVLVGAETCRLVSGFFEIEELPSVAVPGSPRSLRVHRVLGGSGARNRVHAAGSLTPLVGCDQELGLLEERWERAREGRGQVVLLSAEAGLGKSRLVWELRQRLGTGAVWLEGQASPFHRDSAFHPILQWLDQWIGADREDAPEIRLARLEEALARHGLPLPEACPLIAALLGLPVGDRWPLPAMPPEIQRRRTVEVLLSALVASTERQPLALVLEDLHWIDPSSSELLGHLAEQAAGLPLLLLATFRPEGSPAWEAKSHLTRLTLAPLGRRQTSLMIEQLCAGRELDRSIQEKIAERADGVPLFVEELMKMLEEWDGAPDGRRPREIPGSLEAWLGARLDRLETARQVAQLASVLGREFTQELLSAVAYWDAETLQREVDRLIAAEILYRQGLPPRCRYRFKHALLQDAAYASLLRAERQRFHLRIAEVLHERFQSLVESQPELAAHHFTEAGQPARAVPLWQQAGEKALLMSANPEALSHLSRALSLLAEMPESFERDRREMALQTALGVAIAKKGHEGLDEAKQAYSRAWELWSRVGQPSDALPVLRGVYVHAIARGKIDRALKPAEELVRLARQENDPFFLLTAYQGTGMCHLLAGHLSLAREHLEASLSHLDARLPSRSALVPGPGEPAIEALADLAWTLWFLGYPDSALERAQAGLALAGDDVQAQARGFINFHASRLHLFRGEVEAARARAQDFVTLAADPSLRGWAPLSRLTLGGTLVAAGRIQDGFELVHASTLDPIGATVGVWKPLYCATIAEAWLACGDTRHGLAILDEALAFSAASGQAFFDAELWRLRAGALLQQGATEAEAEPALTRALDIAREQGAKSLELRVAIDLARLWSGQHRQEAARDLLAGIYGWFTEGFDTTDLRTARDLLAELTT